MWSYEQQPDWLDRSNDVEHLIAQARVARAQAVAHYVKLGAARLAHGVAALLRPFRQWQERLALRAELDHMSDLELRDIGLSRCDIDAVVDGSYRDERAPVRRRPLLVRLDPGPRRVEPQPGGTRHAA